MVENCQEIICVETDLRILAKAEEWCLSGGRLMSFHAVVLAGKQKRMHPHCGVHPVAF